MKWISVFCSTCIFLCASFIPEAAADSRDSVLQAQAQAHTVQGNYFEAALAWERVWFLSGNAHTRMHANVQRALALKQIGQFERAKADLQRSVHLRRFPELHKKVLYEMAFCDFMLDNFASGMGALRQLEHFYPDMAHNHDALLLFSLSAVRAQDWNLAQEKTLQLIGAMHPEPTIADSLELLAADVFCACAVPQLRSADRAARWSTFIPGSGQLYAGHPGKGLINAGSQLASLGMAGYMAWHNLYISGFVIGLGMFQSFYFGGVKQASFLAQQQNYREMADYKTRLEGFIFSVYNYQSD